MSNLISTCKSYLKLAKECRSLSYDAITAHTAIVFARYMMLSVENRESEVPRTMGEIFTYFIAEIADVTFAQAFRLIMDLFSNIMTERFELSEEEISSIIKNPQTGDVYIYSLGITVVQALCLRTDRESPTLPDEDPVLRSQVHGVPRLHAVGLMELVKLLQDDVGSQICQGMGVIVQNV